MKKRRKNNYQELRKRVFQTYLNELEKSKSGEAALTSALDTLKQTGSKYGKNKKIIRFIEGVKAELLFYHIYRKEYSLRITTSPIDKYLHIDFTGISPKTKELMLIDVTKAPQLKLQKASTIEKWKEVIESLESLRLKGKYFIAAYDPDKNELELGPLLLPVHKKGYLGFYIAKLESIPIEDSFLSRLAVTIGTVYVVPKQWTLGRRTYVYYEVKDFEVLHGDMFEPYQPPSFDLMHEVYDYTYYSDKLDVNFEESKNVPTFREFVYKERFNLAYYYRKTLGIVVSTMFEEDYIIVDPRNAAGYWSYRMTWIHPVIKKRFGTKIGSLFDLLIK